ncbi:hypothetical protein AVEN_141373-1 [Araneus ventricosus]|uniref:Uncharacterized protein n=1 Tax=Araneus ventricosus TaxID=182803 RepID=A0A4Y2CYI4_ARAVE|nr:hypothetical protein AVEN_141373-1 [Araneus ventricosus]
MESNDVLAKSVFASRSRADRVVQTSRYQAVGREFYPRLCSYSVLAIICNEFAVQVRPMVTSKLPLTCCKLVHLHSCRVKFAVSLQICSASLLQIYCKLKLQSGKRLPAGVARKFVESCQLGCRPRHLTAVQNDKFRPLIAFVLLQNGTHFLKAIKGPLRREQS